MRAIVHEKYGPPEVLELVEIERPSPAADEVLIKIHATTVNRTDCAMRKADPFFSRFFSGLLRPRQRILGSELAGEVEAVGAAVTQFAVGDPVFGVRMDRFGAHAEYVCMKEGAPLAEKPSSMTFEEAAAVCDGVILALTGLKRAKLRKGQRILIYGASGSIGSAAVQLARYRGAEITAVCNSTNVDTVKSLGADRVLDYTQDDFLQADEPYDVVFDAVGKSSFRRFRSAVKPGGHYVTSDLGFLWHVPVLALLTSLVGTKKVSLPIPRYTKADVLFLKGLIDAGQYRAVIDRRYPLEHIVDATRYVETEQKTGNVVLTISHNVAPSVES